MLRSSASGPRARPPRPDRRARPLTCLVSRLVQPRERHRASACSACSRNYSLGYDLDEATIKRLLVEQRRLGEIAPLDDAGLLSCEDSLLDLFADIGALYHWLRTETDNDDELGTDSSQEYLLAFLQWLDAERAGLPASFVVRLEVALGRYGVSGGCTALLSSTLRWCGCSAGSTGWARWSRWSCRSSLGGCAPVRSLDRWPEPTCGDRLDRLSSSAAQGRHQVVAELARDVRFHYFEEPVLDALVAASYQKSEHALDQLAADAQGAGHDAGVQGAR